MELRIAVTVHILGALTLFSALAVEWASLTLLHRAATFEEARGGARLLRALLPLGIPATLLVLATGIMLASQMSMWSLTWVQVAVPTMVAVAIAGAAVGPRRNSLVAQVAVGAGPLPAAVADATREPRWARSLRLRSALLVGLAVEMAFKPDDGLALMGAFAAAGALWAALPVGRSPRPAEAQ